VKTIITIIGAGATGKTTLSRALAGENALQHHIDLNITQKGERKRIKAPYVLGHDIAIAGNLKNTSDAIGAMDALHKTIDHCLTLRDTVIMDGFRCTQKLVRWVQDHPLQPAALFVYIELSLHTNIVRLRGRRNGNGVVEDRLPPKTFQNILRFRERSLHVWQYARRNYRRQPVTFLQLPEANTTEQNAALIREKISYRRSAKAAGTQ
jgi:adenylate kinase family enzyme